MGFRILEEQTLNESVITLWDNVKTSLHSSSICLSSITSLFCDDFEKSLEFF